MAKQDVTKLEKEINKIKTMLNEKHPEVIANTQFLISALRGQQKFIGEVGQDRDRITQTAQMIQNQFMTTQEFIKEKDLEEEFKTFMEVKAKQMAEEADAKKQEMEEKIAEQKKKMDELKEAEEGVE